MINMIITEYENILLNEDDKKYFFDLTNIFFLTNYETEKPKIGKYQLDKNMLEKLNDGDIDVDFLLYTHEGNMLQDLLIIKYYKEYLIKNHQELINEFVDEYIFLPDNISYTYNINEIEYNKINEKVKLDIKNDYRGQSIKITLTSILSILHSFGIKKVKEFFDKKNISCDENFIPITLYIKYFENYDLTNIIQFSKKKEKIIISDNISKIEKVTEKDEFLGQKTNEKSTDVLKNISQIRDSEMLKKIFNYIKEKNFDKNISDYGIEKKDKINLEKQVKDNKSIKNNNNKENNRNNNNNNDSLNYDENFKKYNENLNYIEKRIEEINNNIKTIENKNLKNDSNDIIDKKEDNYNRKENQSKYIVRNSPSIEKELNNEYNQNYENDPNKYIEDYTNRKIMPDNYEDTKILLKENNNKTKNKNGIGDIVKQKGFDRLRNYKNTQKYLNFENFVLFILENNKGRELEVLENSLEKFSCKYIKESLLKKTKSIVKNIFLSKVSNFVNNKLNENKINFNIDLKNYDFLDYGDKDIDDIQITGDKKILDYLKYTNLVEKSYLKDFKGVRKFPRSRRLFDNILIKYLKNRIKYKYEYFDGVEFKDYNLVRLCIIYIDELKKGLDEEDYKFFEKIGSELNITKLFMNLYENKKYKELNYIDFEIKNDYENYVKHPTNYIDKNDVLGKFNSLEVLKSSLTNINLNNFYYFYKKFYTKENDYEDKKELVIDEFSNVKCSFCDVYSKFININSNIKINNKKVLSSDNRSIIPFPYCKACKVCKINLIGDWNNLSKNMIKGKKMLTSKSKIMCSYGGIISLENNINDKYRISSIKSNEINNKTKIVKNIDFSSFIYLLNMLMISYNIKDNIIKNNSVNEPLINEFKSRLNQILKSSIYVNDEFKYEYSISFNNNIYDMTNFSNKLIKEILKNKNLNLKTFLETFLKNSKFSVGKIHTYSDFLVKEAFWMNLVFKEYEKYKNQKEWQRRSGDNLRNKIIEYHKIGSGIKGTHNVPWCSSFVSWILVKCGILNLGDSSSLKLKNKLHKLNEYLYGSIVVFKRYSINGDEIEGGHIGFFCGFSNDNKKIICLGGNQNNELKQSYYNLNKKTSIGGGYLEIEGFYWPIKGEK